MKSFPCKRGLLLIWLLLTIACNKPINRNNEITKIELATGDCFGECPLTVVSVDSTLTYKFYGGQYAKKKGYYTAHISQGLFDTLIIKLMSINYKQLNTSYEHSVDDQSLELIVHYQNKVKHVRAQSSSLPDSVSKVFYFLANTYKAVKLTQIKDSIRFETVIQKPLPVDLVKFPPNFRVLPPKSDTTL